MKTLKQLRQSLEQKKGKKQQITKNISSTKADVIGWKKELKSQEQALEIIKQVGLKTQQQLSYNIAEITTMALHSVLRNPYDLELEFVSRRDKTECDIWLARDGNKYKPLFTGGGAKDVAAFALRVASWSMSSPKSRATLILDEPFKHLKGEKTNRRMLDMVHQISKKLGIQIIMVSDERVSREATLEATDLLIDTSMKKKVSQINLES
jgi:hypothetical protein